MQNVTGSLQEKNGVYYAVIRYPDKPGHLKQKWISTKIKIEGKTKRERQKNRKEAENILDELINECEEKVSKTSSEDDYFVTWINEWAERKKGSVRLITWELYDSLLKNHILPYFEPLNLKISEITPRILQKYIDTKVREGLRKNSIKKHMVILNGTFKMAKGFSEINYNPCDSLIFPKEEEEFVGNAYTVEQANKLIGILEDRPISTAVMLGIYLGLRRSEVAGLRWRDIDFDNDVIKVRNTVVKLKTLVEKEATKSKSSKRDLVMPSGLKNYLLEVKENQDRRRKALGNHYHEGDHVCVWEDGRPLTPDYITRAFSDLLKANGLPHIRFHDLRHTAGSILLEQGQNMKQIQEFLGHKDIYTTMNIYTHLTAESKSEAAGVLDSVLNAPVY